MIEGANCWSRVSSRCALCQGYWCWTVVGLQVLRVLRGHLAYEPCGFRIRACPGPIPPSIPKDGRKDDLDLETSQGCGQLVGSINRWHLQTAPIAFLATMVTISVTVLTNTHAPP